MSCIKLHYFQEQMLRAMKESSSKRKLVVSPMGSGKTETFLSYLSENPDKKILIVVDKKSIAENAFKRAVRYGINTTVNYSGDIVPISKRGLSNATISLIQSIHKIPIHYFDTLILDEVHVAFSGSIRFENLLADFPGEVIGLTATPLNQKGLIYGSEKYFKCVSHITTFKELEQDNFILPIRALNKNIIETDKLKSRAGDYTDDSIALNLVDKLDKIIADMLPLCDLKRLDKVAIWCPNIFIANVIKQKLLDIGQTAICHHSESEDDISEFEQGHTRFICFVNMISTGYDFPPLKAIVSLRPTKLLHLWIQTTGRVARKHGNKKCGYILDYASNFIEHGHPYDVNFDLIGEFDSIKEFKKATPTESKLWTCSKCHITLQEKPELACPECGYNFEEEAEKRRQKILASLSETALDPNADLVEVVREYQVYSRTSAAGNPMNVINVNNKTLYFPINYTWSIADFEKTCAILKQAKQNGTAVVFYKKNKGKSFWSVRPDFLTTYRSSDKWLMDTINKK